MRYEQLCADCGGFDVEWMYHCVKHNTERCRWCSCPYCDDEAFDDYEEDGVLNLEDQLENALERSAVGKTDGT